MFGLFTAAAAEGAAEITAKPTWLQTVFMKFGEFPAWGWGVVAVLMIVGIALYASTHGKNKTVWTTKKLASGAICMALSVVLGMIRLWRMPMGGSVTPASMLPLMLFACVYGAGPGVTMGMLFGALQFILDGGEFAWAGLLPNLLDYPLGFGLLGLCGLAQRIGNERAGLMTGVLTGCAGRWLCSFLSGWIFYGSYAPEGWNPIVYSLVYNGTYIGIECAVCIAIALLAGPRLLRAMRTR